ncbi:MAG: MBOAT family protein [Akkermansia sp.]|nr:MBOAT family protein [Akkermansia sp.]
MLFSSFSFVFAFLPLVLLLYYLRNSLTWRNNVLLGASLMFYAWGEPRYLLILLISVTITWLAALAVDRWRRYAALSIALALILDLGILIYFKYTNFILENLSYIFNAKVDFIHVVMPIGISFYTFQAISYLIDVYRRDTPVQRDLHTLLLYITLFPQLVAGPIVKYHDIYRQIDNRRETLAKFTCGARRFIIGLSKKMLIANTMGEIADKIFTMPVDQFDTATAWLGAITYTFQIYFDFSGYSDMAIGLCLMFGFSLPENFNYPYISRSITEFWRRWHISLSTWFKEYLYIPLGGNRVSKNRNLFNLFVVFLTTGIWHGASWCFVIWGLWHGLFIIIEKITGWHKKEGGILLRVTQHITLLFIVIIGWVFFRGETLSYCMDYLANMFGLHEHQAAHLTVLHTMNQLSWGILALAVILSMPLARKLAYCKGKYTSALSNTWCLVLFVITWATMAASTYNPFIYFRF